MVVAVLYKPPKSQKITCTHCDSVLAFSKADYTYDEETDSYYIVCPECAGCVCNLHTAKELNEFDLEKLQQNEEGS